MTSGEVVETSSVQVTIARSEFLELVTPFSLHRKTTRALTVSSGTDDTPENNFAAFVEPISDQDTQRLHLANTIADLTGEHEAITRGLLQDPRNLTLRDVATKYSTKKLAALIGFQTTADGAESTLLTATEDTPPAQVPPAVMEFQRKVFHREPTAVICRMVRDGEIAVDDAQDSEVQAGVATFLENNADFNIRQAAVSTVTSDPKALAGIPDRVKNQVVASVELLQTTQSLTHAPEALSGLVQTGMTSAYVVAQTPEDQFISQHSALVGGEGIARDIHVHATNVVIRNDLALTTLMQTVRGTGIAMIDGDGTRLQRVAAAKEVAQEQPEGVNLEKLFGSLDVCACDDCNSVTSPAAYFVELLQYLRNNTLDPTKPASHGPGYEGTPLESLLRRRPDLADLELTCANTNTVLPYIDLANEVMESFIVNLPEFASSSSHQAKLDVFNADTNKEGLGGSSPELLAQPQHTNDKAYSILKEAVYPPTKLPFHQPVEAIRLYLSFLQTNRADLGSIFQKPYKAPTNVVPDPLTSQPCPPPKTQPSSCSDSSSDSSSSCEYSSSEDDCAESPAPLPIPVPTPLSAQARAQLGELHKLALSRADDAERLLLTEEEYVILTKETFWTKEYFDIRHGVSTPTPQNVYRQRVGVKPYHEYWGVDYANAADMLDVDESAKKGVAFVKAQFLPRTGLAYAELVDLIKTDFINPNMPKGRDNVIVEAFRFTYRLMQALAPPMPVGHGHGHCHCHPHKWERFRRLVDFILNTTWRAMLKAEKQPDPASIFEREMEEEDNAHKGGHRCADSDCERCHRARCRHHHPDPCQCRLRHKITKWLSKNFDRIGKVIVLDSTLRAKREMQFVRTEADLVQAKTSTLIGHMAKDGTILGPDKGAAIVGAVQLDGTIALASDDSQTSGSWYAKYGATDIVAREVKIGSVGEDSVLVLWLVGRSGSKITIPIWGDDMSQLVDDCDISKDRLKHLNGTSLCHEEYDRMHRFIRLWRKLGWSMVELDVALTVCGRPLSPAVETTDAPSIPNHPTTTPVEPDGSDDVDWLDFVDDCKDGNCGKSSCKRCYLDPARDAGGRSRYRSRSRHYSPSRSRSRGSSARTKASRGSFSYGRRPIRCPCGCKSVSVVPGPDITPDFLHQLVAVKKLVDLTGLELLSLLAFWGPISTTGSPSLYKKLFLTHNLLGIDQVFQADANGNYLAASPPVKMSDHVYILLAAFGLRIPGYAALTKALWAKGGQDLTIDTVSALYRHVTLGRVLGIKPELLGQVFETLQLNPFTTPENALKLVELWNKISDAGFTFPQIRFVLTGSEDPLGPAVGPSLRTMLQAATTIQTGLNDIDTQHPQFLTEESATSAATLASTQLLFAADVAGEAGRFLDGSLLFQTKAPAGLTLAIPKSDADLAVKLKYVDGATPVLQSTGQPSEDEMIRAKRWSASTGWAAAIDRIPKRAATYLKGVLLAVFPLEVQAEAKQVLLAADTPETGAKKRFFFLAHFVPYLRKKLAEKLIIDTMGGAASLDPLVTLLLLSSVIKVDAGNTGSPVGAMETLQNLKAGGQASSSFTGYLIPDTTDTYSLVTESPARPADILVDGSLVPLDQHSDDDEPPDRWASKPLLLQGGRLYPLELRGGLLAKDLRWQTSRTQVSPIPPSALLGDHATSAVRAVFSALFRCAFVINGFSLTPQEVAHFQLHPLDFGDVPGFDWNKPSLATWKRLADYAQLRNSLPKLGRRLTDLFSWMASPDAVTAGADKLAAQIYNYTLWSEDDVSRLIDAAHFDIARPSSFRNEINLIKLQKAVDARARLNVEVDLLFKWAKPRVSFWELRDIRDGIRVAIRAQYKLSDWEQAIKPTHDTLRQLQSNALTAYLLSQPALKEQKAVEIVDADSLFEFLLIDNQMCPCMETARLKQATSSVHLFVQRCMLGLEPDVKADALDRGRWDWMRGYRLWEANRKVYLYPENWIQPSLRDDKSPLYRQLESDLNGRDLGSDAVLEAMKEFLFRLDEIGNLEVDAIHYEDAQTLSGGIGGKRDKPAKIHFFARTRAAPYKFYYRAYDTGTGAWQPWQDMTVDIPRYEVEKTKVKGQGNVAGPTIGKPGGFYLVPFTFNSRLFVAIPQFQKVQLQVPVPRQKVADLAANMNADEASPIELWEIKMGLSEMRNGRWTPKQVTSEAISELPPAAPGPPPPIGAYKFVARTVDDADGLATVYIDVYRLEFPATTTDPTLDTTPHQVGRFTFTGSHFGVGSGAPEVSGTFMKWSDFQFQAVKPDDPIPNPYDYRVMYPIQVRGDQFGTYDHEMDVYVKYPVDDTDRSSTVRYGKKPAEEVFYHPFVHNLLDRVSRTDNLDDLFAYFSDGKVDAHKADAFGAPQLVTPTTPLFDELFRPYSLYNWELGFHAPMALVDRLLHNQQFDLALKVMHYVFDPLAAGPDAQRCWKWPPFRDMHAQALKSSVQHLFDSLKPGQPEEGIGGGADGPINAWRKNPFAPHVVARLRPTAYMKYVVMKYIEILIAYGDYYFRQNTLETIPLATQCYVLASHIYGRPTQKIPKRGNKQIQTYRSMLDRWDAFGNAMVQMEVLFPFSVNQVPAAVGASSGGVVGLANIFGFAATRYFCIPDNQELQAVRTTIDDRLFKLRHCQDIRGVERRLPLYEPPIDPGLLVQATAAGLSLSSVLNDLNSPLPNFRFRPLLRRGLEMCQHLKDFGVALIAAKERRDGEALLALKQSHQGTVNTLIREQKKLHRDEATKAVEVLQQSRKEPEYRMKHTLKQLGEDPGSVLPTAADIEGEFKELADKIELPAVESGLKLIASEKDELEKLAQALNLKPIINSIETAASEMHILPTFNIHASLFGVGPASCWGPANIARGIQGAAKAYQAVSDFLASTSSKIAKVQSLKRATEQRTREANSTGHEIKKIDHEIVTQQVRVAAQEADMATHERATEHAQEVHEFLTSKYTATELYEWADQQTSELYYRTYTAAYDLARKAELAFRYERGLAESRDSPPFIRFGYWEPARSGLLCGERLMLDVHELERAHHTTRGHDYEVTKHVSLRSLNPLQLLRLRDNDNATAEFAVPEILFDMDFPGHYGRRLKSAALTISIAAGAVVGPYDDFNATLRLTKHSYRSSAALPGGAQGYAEKAEDDERFRRSSQVPIDAIATSSGLNDAGLFELSFSSEEERFLPFEGAGAISTWRVELNGAFPGFDHGTIDDVVLTLRYTSLEGGARLRDAARRAVTDYIRTVADMGDTDGLFAAFDIRRDFPEQWAALQSDPAATKKMVLGGLKGKLPAYTKGYPADKIQTRNVWIATDKMVAPGDASVKQGASVLSFSADEGRVGRGDEALHALHSTTVPLSMKDWEVGLGPTAAGLEEMWILVRYSLKNR